MKPIHQPLHLFVRHHIRFDISYILVCGGIFFATCLIVAGLVVIQQRLMQRGFGSDAFYLICLFRDIFVDGYGISGWYLTPAPYFFPDMVLLFPLLAVFREIGYCVYAYNLLFAIFSVFLFTMILSLLRVRLHSIFYASITYLIFMLAVLLQKDMDICSFFFFPTFHGGCILAGMLFLVWILNFIKNGGSRVSLIAYSFFSFLMCVSDLNYIPQLSFPIVLALSVCWLCKRLDFQLWWRLTAVTLFPAIAAYVLLANFERFPFPFIISLPLFSWDFPPWRETTVLLLRDMKNCILTDDRSFGVFFLLFAVGSALVVLFSRFSKTDRRREFLCNEESKTLFLFVIVVFWFSIIGSFSSRIFVNSWFGIADRRFFLPFYIFPIVSIAMLVYGVRNRIHFVWEGCAAGLICLFAVFVIFPEISRIRANPIQLPYLESIRRLDQLAETHVFRYGYGGYWYAKSVTVQSRAGVRVNQLHDLLNLYHSINNIDWYRYDVHDRSRYPLYQFIITNDLLKNEIERRFGQPAWIELCGDMEVYIYNREEDIGFRNYLRHKVDPYLHVPVSPLSLRYYKRDGTAWDAPDNVIIQTPEGLHVSFDPPANGDVLELSTDDNDAYEISFYGKTTDSDKEPTCLHRLEIPPGNGWGLRAHYVRIPFSFADPGISFLIIKPLSGDKAYSVGHVFIYKDSLTESGES
ncbi:MAG: hypothetical protein C4527_16320 [Candidatus Omnitrophota bacterium]|jgi:hypothetical protein|nr:MAG: hypothetical protein C4527_16320 [Candidatus Omnitrophota bacterium]